MHSRLFRIERFEDLPVERISFDDPSHIKEGCDWYCFTESWEDDLEWLSANLPKGCFSLEGNTLTLLEKPTEFLEDFLDEVKMKFNLLTPKNLGAREWYTAVEFARTGNLDAFCVYSEYFSCSVPMLNWLMEDVMDSEVGQQFVISEIYDLHH